MAGKILIVDDNEGNRKLLRVMLRKHGYETSEARHGEEAVALARAHVPDMILMDIQMPVMDGIEAMRILKGDESTRRSPIVAVTSFAMRHDRERFLSEGFDGYISKPIGMQDFLAAVKQCLFSPTCAIPAVEDPSSP